MESIQLYIAPWLCMRGQGSRRQATVQDGRLSLRVSFVRAAGLFIGKQHFVFPQAHVLGNGVGGEADHQNNQDNVHNYFVMDDCVSQNNTSVK